jgi:hypothetical protein
MRHSLDTSSHEGIQSFSSPVNRKLAALPDEHPEAAVILTRGALLALGAAHGRLGALLKRTGCGDWPPAS